MRIQVLEVYSPVVAQTRGNVSAQHTAWETDTSAAVAMELSLWSVDAGNHLIIDAGGEPMALRADGYTVLQSDAGVGADVRRTVILNNTILVY